MQQNNFNRNVYENSDHIQFIKIAWCLCNIKIIWLSILKTSVKLVQETFFHTTGPNSEEQVTNALYIYIKLANLALSSG